MLLARLLAAALLAAPLPAAPGEDPCAEDDRIQKEFGDFGLEVGREAVNLIYEIPTLKREVGPLLKSKKWAVAAVPIRCLVGEPLTGMRLGHTAYIDLNTLVAAKKEAEALKVSPKRLARFVAWWRLPSLLHEFDHLARTRELAARGLHCDMATLETEVLARHAEARAIRLMQKREPKVFEQYRSLEHGPKEYAAVLGSYEKGPTGLFEAAREDSPGLRYIQETPHEDLARFLAETERESDLPEPRGPETWENRHNTMRHIRAAINDVCREELTDPEKFAAYRKALKELLAAEAVRWRRDNPEKR